MADEKDIRKGVVVDFDFAAMDGATLLHDTVGRLFAENDIPFDDRAEADHLAGGNYQGGFAEYFAVVKTKKTAAKAAKDVAERFSEALLEAIPKSVTPGFKAFVRALSERGVKVVIATRADVGKVAYVADDHTVGKSSTHSIPAGIIFDVEGKGVWVEVSPAAVKAARSIEAFTDTNTTYTAATADTLGLVKQAAAVADATSETVTAQLNALLAAARAAGILAPNAEA